MLCDDIGEYIRVQGEALIAPTGTSMRPLLREDDCQVVLKYPDQPPKKYDVVLYRSRGGRLVLHRILEVREQDYVIYGDHTYSKETGIRREDILGVMEGFYRGKQYVSCSDKAYRCYVRIWWMLFPVRRGMVWLYRKGKGSLHQNPQK